MLLMSSLLLLGGSSLTPVRFHGELCHPRQLIVKLAPNVNVPGTVMLSRPLRLAKIAVPDGNLKSAFDRLTKTPGVLRVEPDRAAVPAYVPNDPNVGDAWAITKMRVDQAWDRSLGSGSAVVAIMDTGVETTHEDLAANIWQNPGEIPANGIDDDGNGYIDDVNGWDFVAGDNVPNDNFGHGTACAGIAAAVGDNALGSSGIAPRARIMALKAARDDGYFFLSSTLPAYQYAADNHAQVLSMSFYSDSLSPSEREMVDYVFAHGCLPVAAAGNDSTVFSYYPGAYDKVLSVAATTPSDGKAGFSDWGSWVDIAAPGTGLYTTKTGNAYNTSFSGTSGACPNVAGVAALLAGAMGGTSNPAAIRKAIETTAVPVSHGAYGEYTNWGRVDAKAALDAYLDGAYPTRPTRFYWISPIGGPSESAMAARRSEPDLSLLATENSVRRPITAADDRSIHFGVTDTAGVITIWNRELPLFKAVKPELGTVYPCTDAASVGSDSFGGFAELVNRDKMRFRVTRRSDGKFLVHFAFRNVNSAGPSELVIRRYLSDSTATKENVEIYDWASNSYPYGNWTNLSGGDAPTVMTENRFTIANPSRYVDFEGTCYVRLVTDGAPSGAQYFVDAAFLKR